MSITSETALIAAFLSFMFLIEMIFCKVVIVSGENERRALTSHFSSFPCDIPIRVRKSLTDYLNEYLFHLLCLWFAF